MKNIFARTFVIFLFPILLLSCTDKQTKRELSAHKSAAALNTEIQKIKIENEQKITNFLSSLSLEEKISQLFIENLEGCTTFRTYETFGDMTGTDDSRPLVAGGYLFFSYNIGPTIKEMQDFTASIRSYCDKDGLLQPYLAVDQEGGWVARLKHLNDKLPSNEDVATNYSISQASNLYATQAQQMASLGFNMNFAPVVEVCTDSNREFLDGRSFGNAAQVLDYGRACINAYENNGISTVVKHFPGNTNTDPHTGLPEITMTLSDLDENLSSFYDLLDYAPDALLMSHARTSARDGESPACLSKVWVTDILREEKGYGGLIFSDDIFMGALADNGYPPEVAAVRAIEAGIDVIMTSEKRFAKPASVLYKKALEDQGFVKKIDAAASRVIRYKIKAGIIPFDSLDF